MSTTPLPREANAFQLMPHLLPSLLLQYLDSRSRKRLAHAAPSVPGFREALRVCIPPDAARRDPLVQRLAIVSSPPYYQARQTRFAIVDHGLLQYLTPIADQVRDLKFTRSTYQWLPQHTFRQSTWPQLQCLRQLVCLTIKAPTDAEIDLEVLSQCLPQLQKLSIRDCYNVIAKLQPLPDLHTLKFTNTNIRSFRIAVGLPKLAHLRLGVPAEPFVAVNCLYDLAPTLQVLEATGSISYWDVVDAFRRHAPLLQSFQGDVDLCCHPSLFQALRSLSVTNYEHTDLDEFKMLVSLEELKIVMSRYATSCQPLQHLKKLRKLQITRGWLRDIIGKIKSLQQLDACEPDYHSKSPRAVLDKPRGRRKCNYPSDLRELSLSGNFHVVMGGGLLFRLQRVEQVKLDRFGDLSLITPVIQQLPRLQRLYVESGSAMVRTPLPKLRSVHCLEEFFVPQISLPKWIADAHQLRKLRLGTSTTSISNCPPNVTHLYASAVADISIALETCRLKFLRVISIPMRADCLVLRRQRRPDGALPHLQCIHHPVVDCLSLSSSTTEPHARGVY